MNDKVLSGFPYLAGSMLLFIIGVILMVFTITGRTNPVIGVIFFVVDECIAGLLVAIFIGIRKRRT